MPPLAPPSAPASTRSVPELGAVAPAQAAQGVRADGRPDATTALTCPTCGAALREAYCGACGERRTAPGDLALRHVAAELWEHATSLDGRLVRTIATLVRHPGLLALEYMRGARSRYTRPLQLYLLVNVAFFFVNPALGLFEYRQPEAIPVDLLARQGDWLSDLVVRRVAEIGSEPLARARFNATVATRLSVVFGLVVPLVALLLQLLHVRRRVYALQHAILAVHLTTFAMLALVAFVGSARLMERLAPANSLPLFMWSLFAMLGLLYLHALLAVRRAYAQGWTSSAVKAAVVTAAFALFPQLFFRAVTALTWLLL